MRQAVYDTMRFWLARGVDGFRVDAIWHMIKDDQLRDNPPNPDYTPDLPPDNVVLGEYTRDRPEMGQLVAELRRVVDEFPERVLGGELYLSVERIAAYYGTPEEPQLHLPFNLQLSVLDWNAPTVADWMAGYLGALPPHAWPNWAVSTHDSRRVAHRAGKGQARVAAMLLLTARGTPTIYYGDEIGMLGVEVPRDQITDLRELLAPYLGLGRDPARTPMQWDAQPGAGFSQAEPWLPVAEDYTEHNVNQQSDDPRSTLSLYRRLIAMRREQPALTAGEHTLLHRDDACIVYERAQGEQRIVVALNLTGEPRALDLQGVVGSVLLSSHLDREGEAVAGRIELRGDEGLVIAS